jgi:polyisoprenoid-binding protein YceI
MTNALSLTDALSKLEPGTWKIDTAHASAQFVARHLMVTKVRGRFSGITGVVRIDPDDLLESSVEATIPTATVDTGEKARDDHLRSADFFEVEKYPEMKFVSTGLRQVRGDNFVLTGDLTIKDTTRTVELELELLGVIDDPQFGLRAGFSASTEVDRKDFGLTWNAAIEAGGVVVGDKVKIEIEAELIKEA